MKKIYTQISFGKIFLAVVTACCCCLLPTLTFTQGTWTQKADVGTNLRARATSFVIGTKGYIGTGYNGAYLKDFWEWDQSTNVWTQKADFGGTARYGATGFAIGTKGYIGTGYNSTYLNDFWEWNQSTNTWVQKANFGGTARYYASSFVISGKGYVGIGYSSTAPTYKQDFWEYDSSTDTWLQKANFSGTARFSAVSFVINGLGYVGTGLDGTYKNDFWSYDPSANTWTQKANFGGVGRYTAIGFSIGSKGYVCAGYASGINKKDFWEYSPANDTWTQKLDLTGDARRNVTGFAIGTKGYAGTGYSSAYLSDLWEYDRCATITATTSKTDATCGLNDGTASITPTGGTSPYTYSWSSGGTTASVSGLAGGIYTVTATDDNGCTVTASIAIGMPPAPTITTFAPVAAYAGDTVALSGTNFGSNSANNIVFFGNVRATAISGNDTSMSIIVPPSADHTYIGIVNNCGQMTKSFLPFISKFNCPDPSISTSTFASKINLSGSSGQYDIASADFDGDGKSDLAVGSNSNFTYFTIFPNTSSGGNISFAPAQTVNTGYSQPEYLTAGDIDGDGKPDLAVICNGSGGRLFVFKNTSTPGNISFAQVYDYNTSTAYAPTIADVDMDGKADVLYSQSGYIYALRNTGSIGVFSFSFRTLTGGLPNPIYKISPGDFDGDGKPDLALAVNYATLLFVLKNNSTPDVFSFSTNTFSLGSGSNAPYDVELSDLDMDGKLDMAVPFSNSSNIYFFQNIGSGTINFTKFTYTLSGNSNSRRLSIADINSDNLPDVSVGYNSGSNVSVIKNNGNFSFATSVNFAANSPTQDVLFSDLNNDGKPDLIATSNSSSNGVSVFPNLNLLKTLTVTTTQTNVSCNGGSNGTATASVGNSSPPFLYQWSNSQTSNPATGLAAANYVVTVTDSIGCTGNTMVTITQPSALSVSVTSFVIVNCFGQSTGAINIAASGGTTPYSYSWSNGATTQNLNGIPAAIYSVTVTDANNCTATKTQVITQNTPLLVSNTYNNVTCNGACNGSASVFASGGLSPYAYAWSGGGTSSTKTGLCAGTHSVIITDNPGCTVVSSITISQPAAVAISGVGIQNVSCNGGSNGYITPFPSGGFQGFTETWEGANTWTLANGIANQWYIGTATNNGGAKSIYISNDSSSYNYNKTVNSTVHFYKDFTFPSDASNINLKFDWKGMGELNFDFLKIYVIPTTITPVNGTQISSIYQIGNVQYNLQENYITSVIAAPDSLLAGQTRRLVFTWKNDNSLGTEPPASIDNISLSYNSSSAYNYSWSNGATMQTNNNLSAGNYSVTVTDNNGCAATNTSTVGQPSALSLSETHTNVTCFGESSGSINITPSGGITSFAYSYLWSNGATTEDLTNIAAGTYSGTVTDANGCTVSGSVTITQPSAALNGTLSATNVSCNGACNGSVSASVTGGTSPYTYLWSTGSANSSIGSLCPGTYTVTITDFKNCTVVSSSTITQPALLSSLASKTDILCNGNCNGTASVSASGGTSPYSYIWSNSQTTSSITGLCAGTYSVTVTDFNSCLSSSSVTINQPSAISSSTTETNVLCNGASTGAVDLTVSGGTTPYSYQWSNGATTQDLTNIPAGAYSGTVTDANGCTDGGTLTITQPSAIALTTSTNDATCGNPDGDATVSASGGTGSFSYLWSASAGNQTTATATGLLSGAHSVTVTDDAGCTKITTATVSDNGAPTVTVSSQTNVFCNGGNNGSASVSVSGGATPYTYTWNTSPIQTSSTATGLSAGTYAVVVTDNIGCAASTGVIITQPAALSATLVKTDVSCMGQCNGSISASVSGGVTPYSYVWSTTETTSSITGLCPATYSVTVTDANNCTVVSSVAITQPLNLSVTLSTTGVMCNAGSDGSVSSTVSGGTSPYSFNWSNGGSSANISNVSAGTYTVTVTDFNGCIASSSTTVSEPTAISANITKTDISCFGQNNGSATANPSGGTTPYSYLWSNGGTGNTISSLSAGTYSLTITDANSCTSSNLIAITEPASSLTFSISKTDLTCNGVCAGEVDLTVSGGTTPYSYTWDNSETTEDVDSLCAGNFSVTISDANNCNANTTVNISEPAGISLIISSTDVNCNGGNNGNAIVNASGGTSPYSYLWSNGDTTSQISNLTSQIYSVTVTDANNCTKSGSATISEPAALDITTFNPTLITCNGANNGAINPTYTGGTTPYSYEWSNGATSASLSGLGAGTYTVTVSDANSCSFNDFMSLTEPSAITATLSSISASCGNSCDGKIIVEITGGISPYTILWCNGEVGITNYSDTIYNFCGLCQGINILDSNNCAITSNSVMVAQPQVISISVSSADISCNGICDGSITTSVNGGVLPYDYSWSNGNTASGISGLCSGTQNFTLTVSDSTGCTNVENVNTTINSPTAIAAAFSQTNISCNGVCNGIISANTSGGATPYTYLWSNGNNSSSLTNLCAGTYLNSVTITDANGCSAMFSDSSVITEPSTALSVSVTKNNGCNSSCNGNATATGAGGVSPYVYHWSNNDSTSSISNLCANIYTVTVTDANGCTAVSSANISQSPSISLSFFKTDVNCFAGNDGSASVSVSGGTPSYNYLWSNGANSGAVTNLTTGTYDLTVTDANGCSTTGNITLISPSQINISFSVVPSACTSATGSATASVSGGTGPYSYLWSNGGTTASVNNLAGGNYFVTITDNKGCKKVGTVNVGTQSGMTATFVSTNILCSGINNGTAAITPSGGTSPFVYSWSSGQNSQTITGLGAGTYSGTVTDNTGCAISGTVQISQPPAMNITLSGYDASGCGNSDGYIDALVSGGASPYSFNWSNGDTLQNISNLSPGNYSVTVTDVNSCAKTKSILITAPSSATISFTKTDATCNNTCNGTAIATASGGTSPYTYSWSNGNNSATVGGLCAGTYYVTAVDAAGCAVSDSVSINQPNAMSIVVTTNNSSCGNSDGSATANVSGGTSPYNYQWSNGDKTSSADTLSSGIYTVTVTDFSGCSNFTAATLSDIGGATVTINSVTHVSCNGGNNGAININVSGGATPFSYSWSNGFTTQNISNLAAGPYEINVTDSSGCITAQSITVLQPPSMNVSVTTSNAGCGSFDGSAIVNVTGGTPSYSYLWSNGATSSSVSALASGIYTVTITDTKSCTLTTTAAIAEIGGPTVNVDSITNPGCGGNGAIYVEVTDGTSPYIYSWSNGLFTEDLVGVGGGTYNLLVTDANGCKGALTANIVQQQPATPEICLLTVDTTLGTNKIVWEKLFGLGIEFYKIYKESTQAGVYQLAGTVPFSDLSVFVDSVANPMQHSWRYKISVVDSCGNESALSAEHKTIHLTINQGLGDDINLIWDDYQGFSYPTYYIWRYKPIPGWVLIDSLQSNLTSYTDFNAPTPFGLRYFVEVIHPFGCSAEKSSENHNSSRSNKSTSAAPPASNLTATSVSTDENGSCNGSATVTASGGVSPYTYLWSITNDTTATANSLCNGIYTCTITDADGDTAMINVNILLVSISENGGEPIIMKVYPNPNKGEFRVQSSGFGDLKIYNLLGEIVYSKQLSTNNEQLSTNLPSGIYFLQLISEKGNSAPLKIVVE